ncbi:MAG: glutamate 5-kinase [Alphaproteobacteria bacterium]|nr:glutamate 5-kinase [Alphaproteobacteria bacterium]
MKRAPSAAAAIVAARRIVIKVGSSLIVGADGRPNDEWLDGLATDIAAMRRTGKQVLVVSSGAVAIGRRMLGRGGPMRLEQKQAASAVGQARLIDAWARAFAPHDAPVGQMLLTLDDTTHRRRYLNARATLAALLDDGAVPVINENDTLATSEIRYGDNDRLAAHVAELAGADLLVILSDVDGLYARDPNADPDAEFLSVVETIDAAVEAMAGGTRKDAGEGAGGMATKLAAAKIVRAAGCATVVARGEGRPFARIDGGGRATLFCADGSVEAARKTWIRNLQRSGGAIRIDAGAVAALKAGASLLPVGVVAVEGAFQLGDVVVVEGPEGARIAKGLVAFDADDLRRVAGLASSEVAAALGYRRRDAVIDRDDLVLTE